LDLPVLPLQSLYQLFPGSEVFMLMNKKKILLLSSLVIFFASCTIFFVSCAKVEYINPLDPKSENYVGPDSAGDRDGDGIANIYDKDDSLFRKDTDYPVIELLGKNPDTLRFKLSEDSKFNERINQLKQDYKCYDPSDKSIDNSDVIVDVNVALFGGNNYNIKYSVSDTSGNYTRVIRDIVVEILPEDDTVAPSISPNADAVTSDTAIIYIGTTIDYLYYVYISDLDNSVFEIGKNVTLEGNDKVDINKVGIYKVKYTAVDSSGNRSSYTIYFKVIDDGGSHSEAKIFIYYNGEEIDNGYTFEYTLSDVDFDISLLTCKAYETVNNETRDLETVLDCDFVKNEPGQYHATFSIKGRDDVAPKSVYIKVYESGTPQCDTVITLELKGASEIEVKVGEKFVDPGFTATMTKPQNKDVSSMVTVSPSPDKVNTSKEGNITITYEIKYCNGTKTVSKTRTVKVVKSAEKDTQPPTIKLFKSKDTVTVETKYSDYKAIDTGNTVTDNVDKIEWSSVKVDTTGFKTSEAGKPCSLVYTVKDKAGNEGKAVKKIVVIAKGDKGLLEKYGVPTSSSLASLDKSFTKVTTEGEGGPNLSSIVEKFNINWASGQWGGLHVFSINTKSGSYIDLKSKNTNTFNFGVAKPNFVLDGSGINGVDGEYYVVYTDKKFIWVEKTGKFAIIWEE